MPFMRLTLTLKLDDEQKSGLLQTLSQALAEGLGKPETYVMVTIDDGAAVIMSGEIGPAAFADVRSIGALNEKVNKDFTNQLCRLLQEQYGVSPDRVYVNYTDIDASCWGWNNSTFG